MKLTVYKQNYYNKLSFQSCDPKTSSIKSFHRFRCNLIDYQFTYKEKLHMALSELYHNYIRIDTSNKAIDDRYGNT